MVNENVHLDFGDDDSCIHRRLASYRFAMTVSVSFGLFFFFCESIGLDTDPQKFHVFINDFSRPRSR
jgi:hypothetical protein